MTSTTFSCIADIAVIASLTLGFTVSANRASERGEIIKQKDAEIHDLKAIIEHGRKRIRELGRPVEKTGVNEARLHGAFVWDCEECGTENFVRGIEGNLDENTAMEIAPVEARYEAIADIEDGYGETPMLVTKVICAPHRVTCRHCAKVFDSALFDQEDRDEDDE